MGSQLCWFAQGKKPQIRSTITHTVNDKNCSDYNHWFCTLPKHDNVLLSLNVGVSA